MKKSFKLNSNLMNFAIFLILLSAFVASMVVGVFGRDDGKRGTFGGLLLLILFTVISFIAGSIHYLGFVNGIIFITLVALFNPIFPIYKILLMATKGFGD